MKRLAFASIAFVFAFPLIAQTIDPRTTGNVPITFYGKVIDQSNQPVVGAKVDGYVVTGYLKTPREIGQKVDFISLVSDSEGKFALESTNGMSIQISSIDKEGFKLSPKQVKTSYLYNPSVFHPDINNPVIFKMWKKQGAEPLLESAWHGRMACNGTTNYFDLIRGSKNAEGNLVIVCMRTPFQLPPHSNASFDYKLWITIVGGGIQPTDDEFTYLAPENGYLPSFTLEEKAADPKWTGKTKQELYIKTSEGHYGRLTVDWYNWQTSPTHFEWNSSINPSGSRNLER
jgi:hypothetical protein